MTAVAIQTVRNLWPRRHESPQYRAILRRAIKDAKLHRTWFG